MPSAYFVSVRLAAVYLIRREPESHLIDFSNVLIWVHNSFLLYLSIPRSANSCDVLHPVRLPRLAVVWRIRLLPVARCRSDVGPEEARPNLLSLDRVMPIESAHAVVEASNQRGMQWIGGCPAVEPPDCALLCLLVEGPQSDTAIGS